MFADLRFRLRALFRRHEVERELDEELRSHLEHETDEYVRAGLARREAARARSSRAGRTGPDQGGLPFRARHAVDRGVGPGRASWMPSPAPQPRCSPAGAVLSLSLGIGAVTAVFSVLNTVWLKPLPIAEPERVIRVYSNRASNVSYADFVDLSRATGTTLEGLVAVAPTPFSLTVGSAPTHVMGELVTGDYFDVLGIRAAAGRTFLPTESRPGSARRRRHQRRLLAATIRWRPRRDRTDGARQRPSFRGDRRPPAGRARHASAPPGRDLGVRWPWNAYSTRTRSCSRAGTRDGSICSAAFVLGSRCEMAHADLSTIARELEQRHPETNRDRTVSVYAARMLPDGFAKPVLAFTGFLLALAVGLLITAAVNTGSLLLARAAQRRAENGLRLALGATRWRLIRQHLAESLVLAAAGAVGGTLIAMAATRALRALQPPTPVPGGSRRRRRRDSVPGLPGLGGRGHGADGHRAGDPILTGRPRSRSSATPPARRVPREGRVCERRSW